MLAGAQLDQAAAVTGAKLLGGSEELLDASVDQAQTVMLRHLLQTSHARLNSVAGLPENLMVLQPLCPPRSLLQKTSQLKTGSTASPG